MIRDASSDPVTDARALRDVREALRAYEDSHLAETAATLLETTERLLEAQRALSRPISEDWYTVERAARELGYVDGEGRAQKEAFSLAMKEAGVPRAELSRTRIYYHREDLDRALRARRRPGV